MWFWARSFWFQPNPQTNRSTKPIAQSSAWLSNCPFEDPEHPTLEKICQLSPNPTHCWRAHLRAVSQELFPLECVSLPDFKVINATVIQGVGLTAHALTLNNECAYKSCSTHVKFNFFKPHLPRHKSLQQYQNQSRHFQFWWWFQTLQGKY